MLQAYRSWLLSREPSDVALKTSISLPDDAWPALKIFFAYLIFLFLVYAVGFVYAAGVFVAAYVLWFSSLRSFCAIGIGVLLAIFVYGLFGRILALPFEEGVFIDTLSPWIDLSLR